MGATLEVTTELRAEVATITSQIPPDEQLKLQLVVPGVEFPVVVPPHVAEFIRGMLESIVTNGSVQAHAMPEILTTTVAASALGVSRPTLMKLIRDGRIPSHRVGTHTRLRSKDVTAFRVKRLAEQRVAFEELRQIEDAIGIED